MQTTIGGYEILSKLGQGGMGTVYQVREVETGQKLALKVLKSIDDASLLASERFRREFALLSRLRHPDLVRVYQSDIADGTPFYTMELVTGQTINQVPVFSRRPGPQLWGAHNKVAFNILLQLLDGIDYMHRHGIIHRDLKPTNIMLTLEGCIKLMDFGLARDLGSETVVTEAGTIVGTLEYSSPEQLGERTEIDTRSDLYSVGVLLYEITTGRLPFHGDMLTVMSHILFDPPAPPTDLNDAIPPLLSETILKLLQKEPDKRFQSVAEVRKNFVELALKFGVPVDVSVVPRTETEEQPFIIPGERLLFVPRFRVHDSVQDAIEQFLKGLPQGHNRFVIIEAEEGMGKDGLGDELARRAERRGVRVLHAGCDANDVFPYHTLQPILQQARRQLQGQDLQKLLGQGADLITSLTTPDSFAGQPVDQNIDKFRLFDVFSRLLQATSDNRPCMLVVDDIQWADTDSFELLSYLVRELVYPPEDCKRPGWGIVFLMDVEREPHMSERLAHVTSGHDITRIRLEPLTQDELVAFVESILGEHEMAQTLGPILYKETSGNPGFTYETLKGLVDSGNLLPERGAWRLVGGLEDGELPGGLPASLRDAYATRLGRLPQAARDLVVVAAMLGTEFNYSELRHCACMDEPVVLTGLDVLLRHRVLREVRGRRKGQLAFVLPQIRKHLLTDMSFAGQQQLHLQILNALETAYEAGDRRVLHSLAWHARRAGVVDKSLKYLLLAALAAARSLANDRASDLFEQASGLPGFEQSVTQEMREIMFEAAMSAGRFGRANDLARHAAQAEEDPGRRAHWLHRLGRALMGQGKNDEALHFFNASLETLGFKTYSGGALVGSVAWEFLRHLPMLRRTAPPRVSEASAPPAPVVEALEVMLDMPNLFYFVQMPQRDIFFFNNMLRAFNVAHHVHVYPGLLTLVNATYAFMLAMVPHPPLKLIRPFLERASTELHHIEDTRLAIEVARFTGYGYYVIGDFNRAAAPLIEGMARAEKANNARGLAQCGTFLALSQWWTGPVEEAHRQAVSAANKCEAMADAIYLAVAQKALCASLAHLGRFTEAHRILEDALKPFADDSLQVAPLALRFADAFVCYMERNDEAALARFSRLHQQWLQAGLDRVHAAHYAVFAASAMIRLVQTGGRPATHASFDRIHRWCAEAHGVSHDIHFTHGWAWTLEAQVHVLRGHFAKAGPVFDRGIELVQKAGAALIEAECRLSLAETLYTAALTATSHRSEMMARAKVERDLGSEIATRLGSIVMARDASHLG